MNLEMWHIEGKAFHFGRRGLGQEESAEYLTSDTLFAALVARKAQTEGSKAVDNWVAPFISGKAPFILSSAFPRAGGVRFFPVPMLRLVQEGHDVSAAKLKELKKVRFVSEQVFRTLIEGGSMTEALQSGKVLQDGRLLVTGAEMDLLPGAVSSGLQRVWTVERRPRVAVGRMPSASNIYHTGRTVFGPDCGWRFALRWIVNDQNMKAQVAEMLADLGDAGLGGERSSGFGSAVIQNMGELALPGATGKSWVTLSRYLPCQDEMEALTAPEAAYTLEVVGGWVDSLVRKSERRRALNMLVEGSVFGILDKDPPGHVADVQPVYGGKKPLGHPVWRCGLALAVGVNTGAERKAS